jgi:hypothetical protein
LQRLRDTSRAQRLGALLFVILLLLVGTTIPGSLKADIEGRMWSGWPWSASAHFVLFGLIAAIPVYGRGRRSVALALTLAVCLALTTELLQGLVPGRHPLLRDALIDLAGTVSGLMAAHLVRRRLSARTGP